jgi:hypothetical protein
MGTHETGAGVEQKKDRAEVEQEPHHECDEELSDSSHASGTASSPTAGPALAGEGRDRLDTGPHPRLDEHTSSIDAGEGKDIEGQVEGKEGKRKKLELQDQTNLLPVRQVLGVFVGLSVALFCSLLDQTM